MYVLLCGRPPFEGESDREICKKVKEGKYSMSGDIWKDVSDEGKELLKRMLTYDPKKRIS